MRRLANIMHNPGSAEARAARRARIAGLVRERAVHSQTELRGLLEREGIAVNQATLSRDLRAMGLLKGPGGYELPAESSAAEAEASVALHQALALWLAASEVVGNLIVLRTAPGGASPLGVALDRIGWSRDVAGTVAGDDTLLVVCRSAAAARRVARALEDLRGRRRR